MLAHAIPTAGKPTSADAARLITRSCDAVNCFNLSAYRNATEPDDGIIRLAPDRQQTRENLLKLYWLAKTYRGRDLYSKLYLLEANRCMERRVARVHEDNGIRRVRPVDPEK